MCSNFEVRMRFTDGICVQKYSRANYSLRNIFLDSGHINDLAVIYEGCEYEYIVQCW